MSDSTSPANEPNSTSTLLEGPGVLVAKKHHLLVRWSHWLNLPILLGLCQRHLDLLGFARLSTQTRSEYGKRRCGRGYWNLDVQPRARTA